MLSQEPSLNDSKLYRISIKDQTVLSTMTNLETTLALRMIAVTSKPKVEAVIVLWVQSNLLVPVLQSDSQL